MNTEDYKEWKSDPRTEAWFKALEREELEGMDIRAVVSLESVEKTALMAVHGAGVVEGIERCINFVPEGVEP